jgi:hypothetical protein
MHRGSVRSWLLRSMACPYRACCLRCLRIGKLIVIARPTVRSIQAARFHEKFRLIFERGSEVAALCGRHPESYLSRSPR